MRLGVHGERWYGEVRDNAEDDGGGDGRPRAAVTRSGVRGGDRCCCFCDARSSADDGVLPCRGSWRTGIRESIDWSAVACRCGALAVSDPAAGCKADARRQRRQNIKTDVGGRLRIAILFFFFF